MKTEIFSIQGMSCDHCVRHLDRALRALPGVTQVLPSIGSATVTCDPARVARPQLVEAIQEAGFQTT